MFFQIFAEVFLIATVGAAGSSVPVIWRIAHDRRPFIKKELFQAGIAIALILLAWVMFRPVR